MAENEPSPIDLIDDLQISIRAELDQRTIPFPELLNLEPGYILPLTRPSGENVDLFAGKVLLAQGEILVVDSTLAVRVADFAEQHQADDRG